MLAGVNALTIAPTFLKKLAATDKPQEDTVYAVV